MYTFNQYNRLKGSNISVVCILTATIIIPLKSGKNIKWILGIYEADGHYIKELY